MSHAKAAFIEGFTDVTLLFGLFPNNISVIGVGWFLGVVFAFYLIFPFFCFLIHNRLMAWISFAVSLVLNYFCVSYYNVGIFSFTIYLFIGSFLYCRWACIFVQGFIDKNKMVCVPSFYGCLRGCLLLGRRKCLYMPLYFNLPSYSGSSHSFWQ